MAWLSETSARARTFRFGIDADAGGAGRVLRLSPLDTDFDLSGSWEGGLPQAISEPSDQIPANTSTAFSIAIGESETGVINVTGDHDWFRVELVAGQSYAFTLTGSGASPLPDAYLELYDSNGVLVSIDDDGGPGTDSLICFTAVQSGTYFINARAWEPLNGAPIFTGEYTVTAALGPAQNPLDAINLNFALATSNVSVYFALSGEVHNNETATRSWTASEISAALDALGMASAVANITFTQVGAAAEADWILTLSNTTNAGAYFLPNPGGAGVGYGVFNYSVWPFTEQALAPGGATFWLLMHEFGHGLGLAHPHDNGPVTGGFAETMQGVTTPASYGTFGLNQQVYTVMSYNAGLGGSPNQVLTQGNQASYAALDIGLLQQLYGANTATGAGASTYFLPTVNTTNVAYSTIWDASGIDTIAYTGALSATIDLRAATLQSEIGGGGFISSAAGINGGFTIANGVVIENATGGSGDDVLIGNSADNILDGGGGADAMAGGAGNDVYVVDNGGDTVTEGANAGADLVQASVTFVLTANVENLVLTGGAAIIGYGNALDNVLTGNGAANSLYGFDGDDTLDGGAGADAMFGGNGDDTYFVDNAGDVTAEVSALGGTDTVFSSVDRNLTAHIENLTLTGAAALVGAGNSLDNVIIGNSGANTLYGFAGDDYLDGGAGADTLFGGASGDDYYVVDDVGDITVEGVSGPAGGVDTVESWIDRNLNANFENMILMGSAAIAYGNILDNSLIGNAGVNLLYGFDGADTLDGGAGADLMFGGNGDDTYIVDDAGDVTSEVSASGGIDTVMSSVTRNLTAHLENLILTGDAAIDGAGNSLNNVITGNAAANTLYGLGGDDRLDGGLGADVLQGGAGADEYVFSTALGDGNVDAVVGFSVADDTILLDVSVFSGISAGALDADAFHVGASAADAEDRIIYNSASGALYYDPDGVGGADAILFATLAPGLALTQDNFFGLGP